MGTLVLHNDNEIVPAPKAPPANMRFRELITAIEAKMWTLPGTIPGEDFPLRHSFAEGTYMRELFIPKGFYVVGKLHRDSYVNCFMTGDMTILTEAGVKRVKAPCTIVSPPGTKRFGYSHEDVIWVTVHPNPTNTMDIKELEKQIHIDDYKFLPGSIIEADAELILNDFVSAVDRIEQKFDSAYFRELTKKVFAHEKPGLWSDWTEEQQKIYMSGDWEAFSRSRGYSEEEISDLRLWIWMLELGEAQSCAPLEVIKDLTLDAALRSMALDKKGEIMKSSHIPSSKKLPYKEVLCQV